MEASADRRVGSSGVVGGIAGYVLRGLRPDPNPLRRASDRVEATARLAATRLMLFVAPLGALYLGIQVYITGMRVEQTPAAGRHPTTAVALKGVPASPMAREDLDTVKRSTTGRWTAPDGTLRAGVIDAPPATQAGDRVRIWLDRAGRPTTAPRTHVDAVANGIVTGLGILVAALVGLMLLPRALRLGMDRRRLARWGNEWKLFEPCWTGGRRPEEHP